MAATKGERRKSVVCKSPMVDGRWVSLEPVGLFILDKDKHIKIYDHGRP